MPVAFPHVDPLVGQAMLALAAILILSALLLWFLDHRSRAKAPTGINAGRDIIAGQIGDIHNHSAEPDHGVWPLIEGMKRDRHTRALEERNRLDREMLEKRRGQDDPA